MFYYCGSTAIDALISQCCCDSAITTAMYSNSITFIGKAIPKEKEECQTTMQDLKALLFL